eukprot:TRINITY_DN9237_c1_g1_i1.p1 TRINITY_DN9237_c1_g1~~TRINITY_DN9237_c1_g1_i1.p1  ORF type:complete len:100 (-),score=28.75 TRINITY_DN9237_c1_g1_i1:215-514(-)
MLSRMARGIKENKEDSVNDTATGAPGSAPGTSNSKTVSFPNEPSFFAEDILKPKMQTAEEAHEQQDDQDDDAVMTALGVTVGLLACVGLGYLVVQRLSR